VSREGQLAPADGDQEVPWPFHALLAWSLVLVGGFFAVQAVGFFGEFRPSHLWAVYVGEHTWVPAVYAPTAWWEAWRGSRTSALRAARMYLVMTLAIGVLQLVLNATSHGGVLARPWPLGPAWAAPAALLVAFASRGVATWARAEAGGAR
jgi:hypothetical protein